VFYNYHEVIAADTGLGSQDQVNTDKKFPDGLHLSLRYAGKQVPGYRQMLSQKSGRAGRV
jgi:hypothetical protein